MYKRRRGILGSMIPETFPDAQGRTLHLVPGQPRQGGQAMVYPAYLEGRLVAVKVYLQPSPRAESEKRILDEILQDDPDAREWLVVCLGSGTINGRPFLLFPWMDASLTGWIRGRCMAERVAALTSATEAVARLHRSRRDLTGYRVHRDIKPDNLLVHWEGRWVVRLADLGAAKDGETLAQTTNTGVLTEWFAPAEQGLPVAQDPHESWDVHALAVTVYWGITARIPIPALDAQGLLNERGRQLVQLARRRLHGALNGEEQARYDRLRELPAEDLLELDTADGWKEDDAAWLRVALESTGISEPVRERLVSGMSHALRGALQPDWRRRDNDVRRLLTALRSWGAVFPLPVEEAAPAPATEEPRPSLGTIDPAEEPAPGPATWADDGLTQDLISTPPTTPPPQARPPDVRRSGIRPGLVISAALAALFLLGIGAAALGLAAIGGDPPAPPKGVGSAAEAPAPLPEPAANPIVSTEDPKPDVVAPPPEPRSKVSPPPPTAAATPVSATILACPREGVTIAVDDQPPKAASGLGATFLVTPGRHRVTWTHGDETHTATLTWPRTKPGAPCHAFVSDAACANCTD